jgi:hypothetical protein
MVLLKMPKMSMVGAVEKSAPIMRLAQTSHDDATDPAERRIFPRKEVKALVEGLRCDHSVPARQQPQLTLALRDLSLGGLSAISDTPVNPGERLAVYFPPQGTRGGWDASGRVLRCSPSGMGYRLAVEFDALPAAA